MAKSYRLGSAKKRLISILESSPDRSVYYPVLLWKYHESDNNQIDLDISRSEKSAFSRMIKGLEHEKRIRVEEIFVDNISDAEYLQIAINKSSHIKTKKFRSEILPLLFGKHLKSGSDSINLKSIGDLEKFVLGQNLEVQAKKFGMFKAFLTDLASEIDNYLCKNLSKIDIDADDLKGLLFKSNSFFEKKYNFEDSVPLYRYLKNISNKNEVIKSFYINYKRALINDYNDLLIRFERKNMYFRYCTSGPAYSNTQLTFVTLPRRVEPFIEEYKEIIEKYEVSFEGYLKRKNIPLDARKRGFEHISCKDEYCSYVRDKLLNTIFDKSWCRIRVEKKIVLL